MSEPATTLSLPAISASKPSLATWAGASFSCRPTRVSSMPARWKKFVSVGPGISAVTVMPTSFSSLRSASENELRKAFEPP